MDRQGSSPQHLLRALDEAGGQGLEVDRLHYPMNVVADAVKRGQARIDFGRLYAVRQLRTGGDFDDAA